MRALLRTCLIGASILISPYALADDTAVDARDSSRLETVTVTESRMLRETAYSSASISRIDEDTVRQRAAVHPSELITAPGVWISRGNGQEHLTAIRSPVLTGAGSCGAFAVVEEGVPVRGTGFCNVNQLFDSNLAQAGGVEVLRGPGTVLYGSDAQHGVINILSRAPERNLDSLALEAGANDYQRIKVAHSRTAETQTDVGFRVSFNGARDGGYKRDSGYDQQKLTFRHDWHSGEVSAQTLVNLSNLNQETAGYVSGKGAYKDAARKRENPNPEAFRDTRSARAQTRIEIATGEDSQWVITPYARATDMAFLMHFLPGTPLEENGQTGAGVQTAHHRQLSESISLISGVDLELTDAWLRQTQDGGFSSFPAGKQYDYSVTAMVGAAYSSVDWQLSQATGASLGARFETLHYDYDNRMRSGDTAEDGSICINGYTGVEGCRYTRPEDRSDQFENLSLNLSLNHQFSRSLSGVARLARGFRAPQATELYRLQNGQMQAGLDSEAVDSLELGLRGGSSAVRWNLTGYYMEKDNVIFQSSERLNLSDGKTRHYGLEYEFGWLPVDNWEVAVGGNLSRHRYTNNVSAPGSDLLIKTRGNDIDTAPRHQHNLSLSWTPVDDTRVAVQWQSLGRYYTDIENAHEYPGHDLLNLSLRHSPSETVTVGLRVRNLLNADYAERADYSSLGGGDRYFIGEPRSVYGNVRVTF
ncbi:TonB-dependent receptor [Microbulbifer sp.]|uniref:TonB-dependent receptor n=1 Tax=Microbulbifer sp. TaxID=1908541 RepID=UPI00258772D6|nr:TonB-dependent receptor [Microbulbifer sp.]